MPQRLVDATVSPAEVVDDAAWATVLVQGADLGGLVASSVSLEQSRFRRVCLAGSRLPGWKCWNVEFEDSNLANVEALEASLVRVGFLGCKLSGLRITEAICQDLEFRDCRMDYSVFNGVKFKNVRFVGCDMREAEFHDTQFEAVEWIDCPLMSASFHQSRFVHSQFRRCPMDGIRGLANLRGAAMGVPDMVALAEALAGELGIRVIADL